uniref:Uncharacterized protein n=1 Tax=Oryza punctata TaxID=4537 RepID=A0A0E0K8C1_ORYPU
MARQVWGAPDLAAAGEDALEPLLPSAPPTADPVVILVRRIGRGGTASPSSSPSFSLGFPLGAAEVEERPRPCGSSPSEARARNGGGGGGGREEEEVGWGGGVPLAGNGSGRLAQSYVHHALAQD